MVVATLQPLDTTGFPAECGIPVLIAGQGGAMLAGDWKQRLVDQIRKRLQPPDDMDNHEHGEPLQIYVFCRSKGDLGDAADLIDTLRDRRCEVFRPDFRIVDPAKQQRDHEAKLARSHGVVLFSADAQAADVGIDLGGHIIAECPADAPSRAGAHAIGESLADLDAFVAAVVNRRGEMRATGA